MKKKILLYCSVLIGSLLVGFVTFYFVVALNYKSGFTYGTWINGIYCTNKSIEEVNKELISKYQYRDITVSSNMYKEETVYISDVNFTVDYTNSLTNLQNNQNPFKWYKNLSSKYINSYINPDISFDSTLVDKKVSELTIFDYYNPNNDYKIEVVYTENGYSLIDERRKCLVYEDVLPLFYDALHNNSDVFIDDKFFTDYVINREKLDELKLWRKVSDCITPRFTIDLGAEVITIDSKTLSDFLVYEDGEFVLDENKQLMYDEDKIISFVDNLLLPYNTYGKPRDYVTFDGVPKHLEMTLYGTEIDIQKEEQYILDAVKNKIEEVHIPTYKHKAYYRGLNDIGPEFIEVDLTNQKLKYIKNNKIELETDVVTGNPRAGSATPEGVCYIYKKVQHAVLVGENYRSPVDYWMAINGAIGLHDSSWQRAYGGNRYLTYGSHGCVNIPYDAVSSLYDMVEVGIPVIVYK